MPRKQGRQYRMIQPLEAAEGSDYIVRGYASTFEPYVLFRDCGIDFKEQIDPHAFDHADMTDVIMQFDHQGRVFARSSNGSLKLSVDDHGLAIEADLGLTEGARSLYEDIKCGLITRMSFCFTVDEDAYDQTTNTDTITRIGKVYDVSAVSIPANPGTDIDVAARALDGEIQGAWAERLSRQRRLRMLKDRIRLNIMDLKAR